MDFLKDYLAAILAIVLILVGIVFSLIREYWHRRKPTEAPNPQAL